MKESINEEVGIISYFSATQKRTVPYVLHWQNRDYRLGPVDYYHSYMEGADRQHIFELCDVQATLWFRLRLDGANLHWTLEAIHDGSAS